MKNFENIIIEWKETHNMLYIINILFNFVGINQHYNEI